jgi:hypothetical protein
VPLKSEFVPVPVVRILEQPELAEDELRQVLREINDRQFNAVLQILLEAKLKAEAMLRDDSVMVSPGRSSYFMGWVCYSDYTLAELIRLRSRPEVERSSLEPGPE